jgi:hypothetical protein
MKEENNLTESEGFGIFKKDKLKSFIREEDLLDREI